MINLVIQKQGEKYACFELMSRYTVTSIESGIPPDRALGAGRMGVMIIEGASVLKMGSATHRL